MQHISDVLNELDSQQAIIELNKYHCDPAKEDKYQAIRNGVGALMTAIFEHVPKCDDRKQALQSLRLTRMWANSAIALQGVESTECK